MNNFKPGDVILMRSEETGLYRKLKDWLLGSPWGHVAIFFDTTKRGLPLVIESIGRGVMIRALNASEGRYVLVLRHEDEQVALEAAKEAEHLADNPDSWYDYICITKWVLPRLLLTKLGLPLPLKYQRDQFMICSELVAEAYWNTGFEVLPKNKIPLPSDFAKSPLLSKVWEGALAFNFK